MRNFGAGRMIEIHPTSKVLEAAAFQLRCAGKPPARGSRAKPDACEFYLKAARAVLAPSKSGSASIASSSSAFALAASPRPR